MRHWGRLLLHVRYDIMFTVVLVMTSVFLYLKDSFDSMEAIALEKPEKVQSRNKLILADTLAAICTGFAVSPLNTVIDKSVMEFANRKYPTIWAAAGNSLKSLLTQPLNFVRGFEFRWMCFVYLPTFTAGNVMDHYNLTDSIPHPIQKLLAVFLANTITSLIKDRIYIRRLNPHKPIEPLPLSSLMLLFTRDMVAMAAAFTVPPIGARYMKDNHGWDYATAERILQLACPPLLQIFVVPVHLLALGLYNDKGKTMSEHFRYIRSIYFSTVAMRMMRFLPSYGIGGIFNIELRKYLKGHVPFE